MAQFAVWLSTGADLANKIIEENENTNSDEQERRAQITRLVNKIINDGKQTSRFVALTKFLAILTIILFFMMNYAFFSAVPNMYVRECINRDEVFYRWALIDIGSSLKIAPTLNKDTGRFYGPVCSWGSEADLSQAVRDYAKRIGI